MAKFCRKCGSKLDENTGFCPKCDAEKIMIQMKKTNSIKSQLVLLNSEDLKKRSAEKKDAKKAKKKEKMTTIQRVRIFFSRVLLCMILLVVFLGGTICGLLYFNIPILPDLNEGRIFESLNERAIEVEEKKIVMETDTKGKATVIVQMPDYKLLFKEAYASENPDQYLLKALVLGKYEIQKFEENVDVSVDDGIMTVYTDEVVQRLLEKVLIDAINDVSEVGV